MFTYHLPGVVLIFNIKGPSVLIVRFKSAELVVRYLHVLYSDYYDDYYYYDYHHYYYVYVENASALTINII